MNAIMSVGKIKSIVHIAVSLYIPAAQHRSFDRSRQDVMLGEVFGVYVCCCVSIRKVRRPDLL